MDTTNSLKNLVFYLHENEVGKVTPEPKIISAEKKNGYQILDDEETEDLKKWF